MTNADFKADFSHPFCSFFFVLNITALRKAYTSSQETKDPIQWALMWAVWAYHPC